MLSSSCNRNRYEQLTLEENVLTQLQNQHPICNIIFHAGQRIIKGLREKLFGSIVHQEVSFFDRTKTGELVNRLSTDTSVVGQSVTMNISDGLRSSAQASIGLGMMVKRFWDLNYSFKSVVVFLD